MISQSNKSGFRNPWVWGMLAVLTVVLSVNATFIWFAIKGTSHSTLVERDYKTKDRKSNEEELTAISTQQMLAWQTEMKKPKSVVLGTPAAYEIGIKDRDGVPVSGTLEVVAYRASDASKDFSTTFKEITPGIYQGHITFPLKGYWELHMRVVRGEEIFNVNTDKFMVAESQ